MTTLYQKSNFAKKLMKPMVFHAFEHDDFADEMHGALISSSF